MFEEAIISVFSPAKGIAMESPEGGTTEDLEWIARFLAAGAVF